MRILLATIASTCLVFISISSLHAQVFENLFTGSARAMAMGNAVTADPPGLFSFNYNPAGLSRIKQDGKMLELNFFGAKIDTSLNRVAITDAYASSVVVVDGCNNECLFGEELPDDAVQTLTPAGFPLLLPVVGILESSGGGKIVLPMAAVGYRKPGSKFTFAMAPSITVVFGTQLDPEDNPGLFIDTELLAVSSFNYLQPTFSYKINDRWSVGGAIGFQTMGIAYKGQLRYADPFVGAVNIFLSDVVCGGGSRNFDICPEDGGDVLPPLAGIARFDAEAESLFAPWISLGLLWQPTDWLSLGLLYRSESRHTLKGDAVLSYPDNILRLLNSDIAKAALSTPGFTDGVDSETVDIEMNATLPAHLASGISVRITPRFKMNIDLKWSGYSSLDNLDATLIGEDANINKVLPVFPVTIAGTDAVSKSFGMEYIWSDRMKLRAGFENRPRVFGTASLLYPTLTGMKIQTVGLAYLLRSGLLAEFTFGRLFTSETASFTPHNFGERIPLPNQVKSNSIEAYLMYAAWTKGF